MFITYMVMASLPHTHTHILRNLKIELKFVEFAQKQKKKYIKNIIYLNPLNI